MAEYRDLYDEICAAGADVAALSGDEPERSEIERQRYQLPFPLLCDTEREVVQAWDLFNREEKGGIARAAIFLLDRDRRVLSVSIGGTTSRVRAADMLAFLGACSPAIDSGQPRKRVVFPSLWEMVRTAWPALRLALFPPKR